MPIKNVVLVGVGGNLGRGVLPELLKSDFKLSILSRESSTSEFPESIKVFKSDHNVDSLTDIFKQQDAVVSFVSSTALDSQENVLKAAVAAGVKRIIPSEFGNDTASDVVNAALPFFAGKAKAVEYLKSQEGKISWTSIITGPFFDWGLPLGFLGFDFATKTVTLVDEGKTKFTSTNLDQIGRSIISVLKHPDETANKFVYVESFSTTQLEVLAAIEKLTREKWKVIPASSKTLREVGFEKLQAGDLRTGAGMVIQAGFLGEQALEDHTKVEGGGWNERLGLPIESVEGTVRSVLDALSKNI